MLSEANQANCSEFWLKDQCNKCEWQKVFSDFSKYHAAAISILFPNDTISILFPNASENQAKRHT